MIVFLLKYGWNLKSYIAILPIPLYKCTKLLLLLNLEHFHINGSVQNCSNSNGNALELLQSCTNPLILSLTCRTYDFIISAGPQACMAFKFSPDTDYCLVLFILKASGPHFTDAILCLKSEYTTEYLNICLSQHFPWVSRHEYCMSWKLSANPQW